MCVQRGLEMQLLLGSWSTGDSAKYRRNHSRIFTVVLSSEEREKCISLTRPSAISRCTLYDWEKILNLFSLLLFPLPYPVHILMPPFVQQQRPPRTAHPPPRLWLRRREQEVPPRGKTRRRNDARPENNSNTNQVCVYLPLSLSPLYHNDRWPPTPPT